MGVMVARFGGVCKRCHEAVPAGTKIDWSKGAGAVHFVPCDARPAPVAVAAPVAVVVEAAGIVAFLRSAVERGLKAPKVRFLAPGGGELRMSLAGGATKYPGSVQVKLNGGWIGRINADGSLTRGVAGMKALFETIAADPAAVAAAYGAMMAACSFCGKALEDDGSVEVGYGPVCAKRFGLPHSPKGVVKLGRAA